MPKVTPTIWVIENGKRVPLAYRCECGFVSLKPEGHEEPCWDPAQAPMTKRLHELSREERLRDAVENARGGGVLRLFTPIVRDRVWPAVEAWYALSK